MVGFITYWGFMLVLVLVLVVCSVCLLLFSLLGPELEPHCALYAVNILGGFTTSGALGVLLGEFELCVESASLLGIISLP